MRVWRLCKRKYSADAWSGEGARLAGGRWNHPGVAAVYTAESRALAVLEHRVHTDRPVPDLVFVSADLPDDVAVTTLEVADLPQNWTDYPAPTVLQDLGTQWIRERTTVALRVPSAVLAGDRNVVLNPSHPNFARIQFGPTEPFAYDARLFR